MSASDRGAVDPGERLARGRTTFAAEKYLDSSLKCNAWALHLTWFLSDVVVQGRRLRARASVLGIESSPYVFVNGLKPA